jgi:hypothetical protein
MVTLGHAAWRLRTRASSRGGRPRGRPRHLPPADDQTTSLGRRTWDRPSATASALRGRACKGGSARKRACGAMRAAALMGPVCSCFSSCAQAPVRAAVAAAAGRGLRRRGDAAVPDGAGRRGRRPGGRRRGGRRRGGRVRRGRHHDAGARGGYVRGRGGRGGSGGGGRRRQRRRRARRRLGAPAGCRGGTPGAGALLPAAPAAAGGCV